MPNYFLAKTDPDCYSIQDFAKEKETEWNGIHNPQALRAIKAWKPGDLVLIYHSGGESRLMGLAKVTGLPHPDPKDKKGTSWSAKVKLVRAFNPEEQITLKAIKESGEFTDFILVRQGRLSTMACPLKFIEWLRVNGVKI